MSRSLGLLQGECGDMANFKQLPRTMIMRYPSHDEAPSPFVAQVLLGVIFLATFFLSVATVQSQDFFTRITTGDIAQDGGARGVSWADFDFDGDLDLFITSFGKPNAAYRNNGDGTFTRIASDAIVQEGGTSTGCSWGDYDNDFYLDLFVANDSGQKNFLYHNNGNDTFTKINTGAIVDEGGASSSGAWGDYD